MPGNLLLEIDGAIATLTLNRPERRNALSFDLMLEFIDCLGELQHNRAVQAVILAAAGKVFSSGHDLSEMTGRTQAEYERIFGVCTDLMMKIQAIPQPVIAEVQGLATAAGCQLVATCDLAVASEDAAFATPGVRIGLFCTTPMVALTRNIGRKRALEMLFTGEQISAHLAQDWGLVNRVVPSGELRQATRALAERIVESSPLVLSMGKQAYYGQIEMDQPEAYALAKRVMTSNVLAADAQEGISAFLGKRKPSWPGKI